MKPYLFYKATSQSGKSYVGMTSQPKIEDRWEDHLLDAKHGSKSHLHRAIRKYGLENWTVEELSRKICSRVEACDKERRLIEEHDTFNTGYNMTKGGDGGDLISKKTKEEKQAIAVKAKATMLKRFGTVGWTQAHWSAFNAMSNEDKIEANRKRSKTLKAKSKAHGEKVRHGHAARSVDEKIQTGVEIAEAVSAAYVRRKQDQETWDAYRLSIIKRVSKPVQTPIGTFASLEETSRKTGIANTTLRRRIKDEKHPGYFYVQAR